MNKKYQFVAALLVCLMVATMVAGCGQATEAPAPEPAPTKADAAAEPAPTEAAADKPEEALKVAAVFPGTINDEGFNQAGYEGLLMIEEQLGAEIAFSELTPVADFVNTYRDFADQGYDIIIGHGFEFGDVALEVAPDYPDIEFIVDSNPVVSAENVAGITGKTWESAYLLGVIAGLMTETGKIGGIAGFDFPILIAQMEAYRLGAESVRPDVDVTTVYIGSFEDVSQGKEAALAQASAGVDVIFHIADAAGVGVIQAIEEAGIWGLGWGLDQNHLAPDNILSSLLFSGGELLLQDVEKVVDGTWTGDVRLYGLDTGVIGIADYHGLVPDDVAAQVEETKQKIISGELDVPYISEMGGEGADLPEGEAAAGEPLRVAAVFPGTINDQGFNQAGYEGLRAIEEQLGAEIAFSENTPVADFVNTYRDFADQGYNVIIGHGFEFGDIAMEVAPDYPDTTFIVDSNPVVSAENVAGITGKTWEATYLLGVLAGSMTETDKIGGIAGFDFPILVAQMEAYRMGAESVNPDVEVTTVYIGSFEDVSAAKEAALAQASSDVDVIFHIADAAGIGILQAIEEADIYGIGWGLDQNHLAPDNVISSLLFSGADLLLKDVEKVVDGTWTGDVRLYGLDTGVVGIADYHGLVPDDVGAQVEEARQQILSGEIDVPYITEMGGEGVDLPEGGEAISGEDLRVAVVFPGPINDEGFNQVAYEGLLAIEDQFGAETGFSESTPIADFVNVYRDFADQGYNVIIGHGFQFGDVAMEVAPDYPDTTFIVDNNTAVSAGNVAGIAPKSWEPGYLMGMLAALMTETDQVGGIAGYDFPIIVAQMEAYKMGAKAVNPDIDVTVVYIGTMDDVAMGKEAAIAQASAGADVIFHIADSAGIGVIQAAEDEGVWAMGWGADQNHLAPDTVLTSLLTNGDQLLVKDVELITNGDWTGEVRLYGIDSGVVDIADFHGLVPDDVAAQIEEARQQMIDGELDVPFIPEATD